MTIRTLLCSGLALAAFGSLPLTAAEAEAGREHAKLHPGGEHDAKLSDERIAEISARLAERPQLFERIDKNGDGQLSRGELLAARAQRGKHGDHGDHGGKDERREQLKDRFDTNGDGSLSEAERAAAKDALAERRADTGTGGNDLRERIEERADTNGDGSIDAAERAAAKAAIEARIAERVEKMKSEHPELFARLDRDGNGSLDREELRHAKALHHRHQHHGDNGVRDHGRGEGRALD